MQLRQGDTTTITMELSQPLGAMDMKVGIYTPMGKELYRAYLSDGGIMQVDETHFIMTLGYEVTKHFNGSTVLRAVIFEGHEYVNAGEQAVAITWAAEPATRSLKGRCR